jgi:hypothetical protein
MEYLLFIFAKHEKNQEKFVKILAEDITNVSDNSDVNFYYGPESIIYSFNSNESFENLRDFFDMLLGVTGITYFMTPFDPDKMSYWIDPKVQKKLLKTDIKDIRQELDEETIREVQNLLFGEIIEDVEFTEVKPSVPTLDDLLDKIGEFGINSLSLEEMEQLKKHSK